MHVGFSSLICREYYTSVSRGSHFHHPKVAGMIRQFLSGMHGPMVAMYTCAKNNPKMMEIKLYM